MCYRYKKSMQPIALRWVEWDTGTVSSCDAWRDFWDTGTVLLSPFGLKMGPKYRPCVPKTRPHVTPVAYSLAML